MYTGYRYSKMNNRIYITKLQCFNEFANPLYKTMPIDFYTTDCIVEKITDANTGQEIEELDGKAWFPFKYRKGERITGTSIYYCKTRVALYSGYLYKGKGGIIKDRIENEWAFAIEGEECFPGINYIANNIMQSNEGDEEGLYIELNNFFLKAEKKHFPDETRTSEEILHKDPVESYPPEIMIYLEAEKEAD